MHDYADKDALSHGALRSLSVMADISRFMMLRSTSDLNKLFAARRLLEVSMLPLVAQNAQHEIGRVSAAERLLDRNAYLT